MCFFSEPEQEKQKAAARVGLVALGYADKEDLETLLGMCKTIREVTDAGMIAAQTPITLPALMLVLDEGLTDEPEEVEPRVERETIVDDSSDTYDVWVCRLDEDGTPMEPLYPKPMREYRTYEQAAEFINQNWSLYHSPSKGKTLDMMCRGRRVSFVVEE